MPEPGERIPTCAECGAPSDAPCAPWCSSRRGVAVHLEPRLPAGVVVAVGAGADPPVVVWRNGQLVEPT